jgi:heme-degrading monooxygenase HmoA
MVVLVNKLTLIGAPEDLEAIYAKVAEQFRAQPGFISHVFVRSQKDPAVYFNVATWETEESFRAATKLIKSQSDVWVSSVSTGEPHLCTVIEEGGKSH